MLISCSIFNKSEEDLTYNPDIQSMTFIEGITNPYFGLKPGNLYVYEGQTDEGLEHIEIYIMEETKEILGVSCTIVRDTVWLDDKMVEDTFDWYAQDQDGDVWYFGEQSSEYEDGKKINDEGSWEAGVDGAKPGILIRFNPIVSEEYRQEYYFEVAEDMAKVISLSANITIGLGEFDNVLQTEEWNPLENDSNEYKFYVKGYGLILERPANNDEEFIELVEIKNLN